MQIGGVKLSRDIELTHQNLLECAKKHFLKYGYDKASIREICKSAHVTNGAFYRHFKDKETMFCELVEPTVDNMLASYSKAAVKHFDLLSTNEVRKLWDFSEDTIIKIVEYAYQNLDVFRLIFLSSKGTKYENFLHQIVNLEVAQSQQLIAELNKRGLKTNQLCEDEWHILISAYFSSLAEMIFHDYSREDAIKYAHTLAKFFNTAWINLLGI